MTGPTFIIGIDLGTTNTILAYTPIEHDPRSTPIIKVLKIPQAIGPGEVAARPNPLLYFNPVTMKKSLWIKHCLGAMGYRQWWATMLEIKVANNLNG